MLIVNVAGLALIAAIVWWFWIYKPRDTDLNTGQLIITVANGVYQPAHLQVNANTPVTLTFIRRDESPCQKQWCFPSWISVCPCHWQDQ